MPFDLEVLTSPGKAQRYLFVKGLSLEEHDDLQAQMAERWGCDKGCLGRNRVLRLAGFWHMKDRSRPFMVSVAPGAKTASWTRDEVLLHMPVTPPVKTETKREPPHKNECERHWTGVRDRQNRRIR